ncbi:MAG TPA: ABC transporter permease subunit [Hyphomicrobiales bacterium]|nr:ABC transporter permease subunit [Hyphomicrobiales bacterium]
MSRAAAIRWGVVVAAVCLLEVLCRTGAIRPQVVVAPSAMVASLAHLLTEPAVLANIGRTAGEIAVAFLSATVVGFAAGIALHALPRLRRATAPLFAAYYAVPVFIFYPVFVAIFGLSTIPIMLIGFALAAVAMILATLDALDRIPRVLDKLGREMRLGPARAALLLKFPAAAPSLFGGIKLVVSYSFVAVIASEFIVSPGGIGYAIAFAYNTFDSATMYGLILLVVILVLLVMAGLNGVERRIARTGVAANSVATDERRAGGGGAGTVRDAGLIVLVLVLLWAGLSALVGASALPSPQAVAADLPTLFGDGSFWQDVGSTAAALAMAFALSAVIGIVLGLGLGLSRPAAAVVEPLLVSFYSIPKVVFYPIILLTCGIGMLDKVVFGALHGFVPVALFALNAVRTMRPVYGRLARALDLGRGQAALTVALPAAFPQIVSGLRIGLSLTLLGVLISELFAAKRGLGHLISISTGLGDLVTTIAVALVLFVAAVAMDFGMVRLGRALAGAIR